MQTQTYANVILDGFARWGVNTVFAVPGAHLDGFLTRLLADGRFQLVLAAHEQGAAYMADGYARAHVGVGVVLSINGPGLTNLITAAVTAYKDHSRVLFITGDVATTMEGKRAFQASDETGSHSGELMRQALEHSYHIRNEQDLWTALSIVEQHLQDGQRNPVHLNVPINVQQTTILDRGLSLHTHMFVEDLVDEIGQRPIFPEHIPNSPGVRVVIFVGEEIQVAQQYQHIARLSERYRIPVAVTMGAKNMQAYVADELYLGVFGYAGSPRAYEALLDDQLATLLLFGVDLNERNTIGHDARLFAPSRTIVRFSNLWQTDDVANAIALLDKRWCDDASIGTDESTERQHRQQWLERVCSIERVPLAPLAAPFTLAKAVTLLNQQLPVDTMFFCDSGEHRIYAATYWDVRRANSFFTAATTAPMGWAIGAAIGASFRERERLMCVLTGDGCMLMHGNELAVAARYRCRVLFVISNNGAYGRVAYRLKEQGYTNLDALAQLPEVNWLKYAESLGVPALTVTSSAELATALHVMMTTEGPFLLNLLIQADQPIPFAPAVFSFCQK